MDTENHTADALTTEQTPPTPTPDHNQPPPSEAHRLLTAARNSLSAHSRHTKDAVEQLRAFLVRVMEACEYARQSEQNADEVEHELWRAKAPFVEKGDWFRPLVTAAFDEADREREKTNISKYVSVLCYAQRVGKTSADLGAFLQQKSISEIVRLEAEARRTDKGVPTDEQREQAFDAVIAKNRKPVEISGVDLPAGERFTVLVVERGTESLCVVAQATPDIDAVGAYFRDDLRKQVNELRRQEQPPEASADQPPGQQAA